MTKFRIGHGYDVHQLVKNRPLIIGGITIPHIKGALGHSDADVLLHALADALLGALALGDIGQHFPDTDESFEGIASRVIVKNVNKQVLKKGYTIENVDATVILQEPKLSPFINQIRANIANILGLEIDQVSVKATTTERIGIIGREEGIASECVVLLEKTA